MLRALILMTVVSLLGCDGNDIDVRTQNKKQTANQLQLTSSPFINICTAGGMPSAVSSALNLLYKQTGTAAEGCIALRARLAALKTISLPNLGLTDLNLISEFAGLETLNVEGNQIVDLKPIAGFTALTSLNLNRNRVVDLRPIRGLQALKELHLAQNPLNLTSLSVLPKTFDLLDLSGVALGHVASLPALTVGTLQLQSNDLKDLVNFPVVFKAPGILDLAQNAIADLSPLKGLISLTTIHAEGTKVDHAACPVASCLF